MLNRKGMSQALALIVTASVLLFAALVVITLLSDSYGNIGDQASSQGCAQQVQFQCTESGKVINLPSSCNSADQVPENLASETSGEEGAQLECN